jgi:hypothetical protein
MLWGVTTSFPISLFSLAWLFSLALAQAGANCPAPDADGAIVYLARRGWHIDVGMAAADLSQPLNAVATDLPAARYIFFGFGDQHYLLSQHRGGPVLLGALWPGPGLILGTGIDSSPEQAFGAGQVVALRLNAQQLHALQAFIWTSMRTQNGRLDVYASGPYEGSLYFLATAKYSAVHTCNTWAAQALRAAGLPVRTVGVIFAGQLWSQAQRESRSAAGRACSVLAHHRGRGVGRHNDGGFLRGRRAAAADTARQHGRRNQDSAWNFHYGLHLLS